MSGSPPLSVNNQVNILINKTRSDIMKHAAQLPVQYWHIENIEPLQKHIFDEFVHHEAWMCVCVREVGVASLTTSTPFVTSSLCELSGGPPLVSSIFIHHVITTLCLWDLGSHLARWPRPPGLQASV